MQKMFDLTLHKPRIFSQWLKQSSEQIFFRKSRLLTFSLLVFGILMFFSSFSGVQAQVGSYTINSFSTSVVLEKDTTLKVTEEIAVTFTEPRHGIIRVIPTNHFFKGREIRNNIRVVSVKNTSGSVPYDVGRLKQSISLKIGDPDKTVFGSEMYTITYLASNVMQNHSGQWEIYWNVTGNDWDTNIQKVNFDFTSNYAQLSRVECLYGFVEETKKCFGGEETRLPTTFNQNLAPGEGLTLVLGFEDVNTLSFPSQVDMTKNTLFGSWIYVVVFLPFGLLMLFWYSHGRDMKYVGDNVYYQPTNPKTKIHGLFEREHLPNIYHPIKDLTPSEVGTIVDDKVDTHDVVAEILELARLGFIEIRKFRIKKLLHDTVEYAFIRKVRSNTPRENKLAAYQAYLLNEIFRSTNVHGSVKKAYDYFAKNADFKKEAEKYLIQGDYVFLSALKNHFYQGLPVYRKKLYQSLVSDAIFSANPETVKIVWVGIAVFLLSVAGAITLVYFETTGNFYPIFVLGFLGLPTVVFALKMPKRTAWGHSLLRQIEGLKTYLKLGKWRYEHMEKTLFLEEILPLAVALKVVDKLAKDMKGLDIKPPDYIAGFNTVAFASDFMSFNAVSSTVLTSSPSGKSGWSGGSGFSGGSSGGGFGGGGGSSW